MRQSDLCSSFNLKNVSLFLYCDYVYSGIVNYVERYAGAVLTRNYFKGYVSRLLSYFVTN